MSDAPSDLAAFQDAFAGALRGERDLSTFGPAEAVAAGLSVYRNTTAKGAADALRGNFPTVERLVGEAWFADCARLYATARPPKQPALIAYGADFPAFLADFAPAAGLPYLADVAGFDWLWLQAHTAADDAVLTPQLANEIGLEALFAMPLALHPATRFGWADTPAATIWRMNRPSARLDGGDVEIDWRGEGLLLARPRGEVESLVLDPADFAFLEAMGSGHSLGEAAGEVLAAHPAFDLGRAFAGLLIIGVFAAPHFDR